MTFLFKKVKIFGVHCALLDTIAAAAYVLAWTIGILFLWNGVDEYFATTVALPVGVAGVLILLTRSYTSGQKSYISHVFAISNVIVGFVFVALELAMDKGDWALLFMPFLLGGFAGVLMTIYVCFILLCEADRLFFLIRSLFKSK